MSRWLWTQRQDIGPGERVACGMVYDGARERVMLVGAESALTTSDTWEWDGEYWIQVSDIGPLGGRGFSMAYHDHGKMVIALDRAHNTWIWNGRDWTQVDDSGPDADGVMTYDVRRKCIVLFAAGKTWEWTDNAWTQVADTGPGDRANPSLVYDMARSHAVLFGGYFEISLADTWVWDGTNWERVSSFGPSGRFNQAMAHDHSNARIILFGGMSTGGNGISTYFNDTWAWNGNRWLQLQNMGPRPRRNAQMAFDTKRGRLVLFGGANDGHALGDTWEFINRAEVSRSGAAPTMIGPQAVRRARASVRRRSV